MLLTLKLKKMSFVICTYSLWHLQVHDFYQHHLYSTLPYDKSSMDWMPTKTSQFFFWDVNYNIYMFSEISFETTLCTYTIYHKLHTIHNILYTIYNMPYFIQHILYTIHNILYTIYYTPYIVIHTQYIIHHTIYTKFDHCVKWLEKPFSVNI